MTLDGKLIETTGVMSGGGSRVIKGKMGNQVPQKEDDGHNIKALEQEVRHLEEKHEKLFAAKQEFEQVTKQLRKEGRKNVFVLC